MDIPYSRWYGAITVRRSRRLFDSKQIGTGLLERLSEVCEGFRPYPCVRPVIITQSIDRIFKGIIGHYGKIRGAPAFIAFIGDMSDRDVLEKVGYAGEGIVLEATAMGLGTCWVGASFNKQVAESLLKTTDNERTLAVTPIGYSRDKWSFEEKVVTGFGHLHRRKPLAELVTGLAESSWPIWIKTAFEAARLAPSAVNRQPWRFHIEPSSINISVDNLNDTYNISKRIDCGIAMLHIEVAALNCGVKGEWEFLGPPEVARFKIL